MNPTQVVPRSLLLWPGVLLLAVQWLVRFGLPVLSTEYMVYGVIGGIVGGLTQIVWWAFFSRASISERLGAIVLVIVAELLTSRILDKSIATGMMGMMFPVFSVPIVCLAFVAWAVLSQRLSGGLRWATMALAIFLGSGLWALVRTDGIYGDAKADFAWRWSKTKEELLVAQPVTPTVMPVAAPKTAEVAAPAKVEPIVEGKPETASALPASRFQGNWPGFRGPNRDGVIPGVRIQTDWSKTPPVQLWRREVGPGWGSFAVLGDLIFTQEQRGEEEVVACYNATTGTPVWAHKDATRFWESNAGPGPRSTPEVSNGRVFTLGATGILNALEAGTGKVLWSRHPATDTGTKMPEWAFAGSPLVYHDMLIVAVAGQLAAYDAATGAPRWNGPGGGGDGYSSPHLLTIAGIQQVVLLSQMGAASVSPEDGNLLWKYDWKSDTRIMQPTVIGDGDLLINSGDAMGGYGIRRLTVTNSPGAVGWTVTEKWTSTGLKTSFSDSVIHEGYVFGFDGSILSCVDLKDGKRKWKGGRYGHGQFVLLRDQGVLLVLGEEGELALVSAVPDKFTELAKFTAMDGKTWNHPVVVRDRLLVRNGSEMVAFRLP